MSGIFINGRFLQQNITGVQRYAHGIIDHLHTPFTIMECPWKRKAAALLWEHYFLPSQLEKKGSPLLLNLCNTAPVAYTNQVVTIHDMAVFRHPRWFHPAFARYYRWLLPRIARSSRHVVTVSEYSKSEIIHFLRIPGEKISVIPCAVHPSLLHATPGRPSAAGHEPFVLMVGSRDPRKNMDMVVKKTSPLLAELGYKLVIAGNPGWLFAHTHQHTSGEVLWLEGITDPQLNWLYRNAKLVIQPSLYEGFSIVPIESLALGTPVLVSDIPVHREVLRDRSTYFDPNDADDLLHRLRQVLQNSDNSTTAAETTFTFERSAQQWLALIHRLTA